VIACIPIKVSAKAVFSKFSLSPTTSINFGAMTVNTKKQCSFVLENRGEFDFRYAIVAADGSQKKPVAKAGRGSSRAREGQESLQTSSLLKVEGGKGKSKTEMASIRTEVVSGTQRLVLGMFTIQPATGMIPAGQSSEIKVDCTADRPGKQAVALIIEISDRFIRDPPIIYHIYGDVLEPAINTTDIGAIFEEHGVCQSLGAMGPQLFHRKGCVGVYGEVERRFAFKSVIVGQSAQACFKIINSTKIPCDAKLVIASTSSKHKGAAEGFDVEPKSKFTIPSHSHMFATVTFQPTAIQTYTAMFEAYPEDYKQKALTFELHGDGNLPQVEVTYPTLKNAKAQPLLVFRRLLTDQSQTLKVSLRNVGTIPAVVQIRIRSGKQHFTVAVPSGDQETINDADKPDTSENRYISASPPMSLCLDVGEIQSFPVTFHPSVTEKCQGELSLRVRDNQFETLSIQLVGEGYQDDVSIRNIHGGADRDQMSISRGSDLQTEKVEGTPIHSHIDVCSVLTAMIPLAAHENSLDFGDFAVGESRQITFSLSNCGTEPVKFQWPTSLPGLSFSPFTGHLHPSTSKDVSVTFRSDKPVTLKQERIAGKIWKIKFREPLEKVACVYVVVKLRTRCCSGA
jgi:hydrocephalus-inducing protein